MRRDAEGEMPGPPEAPRRQGRLRAVQQARKQDLADCLVICLSHTQARSIVRISAVDLDILPRCPLPSSEAD